MQLEGGKIDNFSLFFLIIGFTIGSTTIISPTPGAGHDSWLAVLAGMLEGVCYAAVFLSLARKFPGKNLIEIINLVFGRFWGKIISLGYLWYFLHLGSLVLRNFGDFFNLMVFPKTPMVIIIGLTILVTASAVRNGVEVITRCSVVLVPLILAAYIFDTLFIIPKMDLSKLLPVFDLPVKDFIKASHAAATFPFGETILLLMTTAYVTDYKKTRSYFISALIFISCFFSLAAARNTAVLGTSADIHLYPSYEAIRLIEVGSILTRLEVIIDFTIFFMGFVKIAVCYYGTALGTAQLLNLRSYLPLVIPIGIIMTILSLTQFESASANIEWAANFYPYYSLPFQIGLPLLALIITFFNKKTPQKAGESR
ncbi:MAG: GerAB/ArcD/ProY family transporter [Peptococcaceae bacterium]